MIVCKPNSSAVIALSGFLLLCYLSLFLLLYYTLNSRQPSLLLFLIIIVAFTLLIFFTVKLLVGYITIIVNENKITIKYTAIGKTRSFIMHDLLNIEETRIKTYQSKEYRQLALLFPKEKFTINNQVYTNYEKLKNHLQQKKLKKKK